MPRFIHIAVSLFVVCVSALLNAQDNDGAVPLGDVARQLRNSQPPGQSVVIDNDNFNRVMDKAESERLDGQPIFAISPSGRSFTAVSPDGTCSLTFDARSANRTAAAYLATDLPQDELLKLQGPASMANGALEVWVHNGTQWDLKEIEVGVTVLQAQSGPPEYRFATLASTPEAAQEKPADLTALYHLKGSAAPGSSALFRSSLEGTFSEGADWHWAIVRARGIPPAAPASAIPQSLTTNLGAAVPQQSLGGASGVKKSAEASTPSAVIAPISPDSNRQ